MIEKYSQVLRYSEFLSLIAPVVASMANTDINISEIFNNKHYKHPLDFSVYTNNISYEDLYRAECLYYKIITPSLSENLHLDVDTILDIDPEVSLNNAFDLTEYWYD